MTGLDVPGDPLQQLLQEYPDEPIVVVNLVRLKPGGLTAHEQYLEQAGAIMRRYGAEPTYLGPGLGTLIGDESWDKAAITTYPSVRALAAFINDPQFEALAPLRHQALDAGIVHVFRDRDRATSPPRP
ncbi:MAG: DUF1330 domain-containing protein [Actinomycetales bacterium]